MTDPFDTHVAAVSALAGAVATIVQVLIESGAVDATKLRDKLTDYLEQDAIKQQPPADQEAIKSVLGIVMDGVADDAAKQGGHGRTLQ